MKFKELVIRAVDTITLKAFSSYFLEAGLGTDEEGEPRADIGKFRRLSGAIRDLQPLQFNKAMELAYFLWQRNPLAQRIIEILVDFTVGDDLQVKVKIMRRRKKENDEDTERMDAQKIWDDFWFDPVNNMEMDFGLFVQDYFLSGELCLPTTVNEVSGKVRLGFIDPSNVKEIHTKPNNKRFVDHIVFSVPNSIEEIKLDVINDDEDPTSETFGKLTGDLFFFRGKRVLSQSRGHSEIIESLDWIDAFEQFVFNNLEGAAVRNMLFYDVTMEGKSQTELDKMNIAAPKPLQVKLHNEKVKWETKTPDLNASDTAEATRMFKNFILAGKGYPEHWFADGGNTNLATAGVMGIPTMRMLKRKQKEVQKIIKMIARFVLDQAKDLNLSANEYIDVEVSSFDFERKDAAVIAAAFVQTMTALSVAVQKDWVDEDAAKKVVDGTLGRLGVEIDPNETVDTIREKRKQKEAEKEEQDVAGILQRGFPAPQPEPVETPEGGNNT